MAKPTSHFECTACGARSPRPMGKCGACGGFGTIEEVRGGLRKDLARSRSAFAQSSYLGPVALADVAVSDVDRRATGLAELDRVLGGGVVPGMVVLLGGEPGIGKSTLVLALCGAIAADGAGRVLYASGEESAAQLRMRANRLGLGEGAHGAAGDAIDVLPETSGERIGAAAEATGPALLVIDSIQTLTTDELEGPAGSVGQVRAATARLRAYAKENGVPTILVGHVTKDGTLAGPKTLEHIVDVVLTLEGERFSGLRLLRSSKNRFGSTEEVGVFEMAADGLREVSDPAAAFIETDSLGAPGVAIAATLEGSRPLLVEVQALVAPQAHGSPRRTAAGLDGQRLALLIAVLGRRAGMNLASHDVYANIVGGLTVEEPAIDLPLALALVSALRDRPLLPGTVLCGEIGLTGELRPVHGLSRRLREAARLGFTRAVVPARSGRGEDADNGAIEIVRVATLRDAIGAALTESAPRLAIAVGESKQ